MPSLKLMLWLLVAWLGFASLLMAGAVGFVAWVFVQRWRTRGIGMAEEPLRPAPRKKF